MSTASGNVHPPETELHVGELWRDLVKDRVYRVSWVGKKKVRLHHDAGDFWITITAWIDRLVDSPDWERVSS